MIAAIVTARREGVRSSLVALALVGCTPIYDGQYNDRAGELEEFRTEFRPLEDQTKRISSGQNRLFWVDKRKPADKLVWRSIIPGDAASEVEYAWSLDRTESDLEEFQFGEQLIAECSFGTSLAYEVDDPTVAGKFAMTSDGADACAVDGRTVYFLVGGVAIRKWDPPTPIPDPQNTSFVDLSAAGIAGQVAAFGVIGNLAVAVEQDGDLYKIDLVTKQATWLRNDEPMVGSVFFDQRGAIYETQSGPRYIELDSAAEDPPDASFDDMVADGGYHLNFKHGDIQTPAGNGEYVIHDRHVIYRGQRGIFAYGLDTHNVIDLLLDRGESIDLEIAYHLPTVTSGAQMFVFGTDSLGISQTGAVYQVDLTGRLK